MCWVEATTRNVNDATQKDASEDNGGTEAPHMVNDMFEDNPTPYKFGHKSLNLNPGF